MMQIAELPSRVSSRLAESDTGCWLWQGYIKPDGYVQVSVGGNNTYLHRLAYELLVGPIPDGLQIDHLCRVRHCCNPSHLEAVTPRVNTVRSDAGDFWAAKTHCPQGHEYTPENTYISREGWRNCRTCSSRRFRLEKRSAAAGAFSNGEPHD